MAVRFVIIGGGPAGHTAATHAARLGAEVTIVEQDLIGGAAHLRDCIPSKAMIATGGALAAVGRAHEMALTVASAEVDPLALRRRIEAIERKMEQTTRTLLDSQGVRLIQGRGELVGPRSVVAHTGEGEVELEADAILLSTGSRPRLPQWASVDGDRVLSTRDAYPPPTWPTHLVVIGSGVTGVEFVHMFSSLGSEVTLIVSRQQVLPQKDPEVAAALEDELLNRGVKLFKGARAVAVERHGDDVVVRCDDGRAATGSHALLAIGSIPNSEGLGVEAAGVETDAGGYVPVDDLCRTNVSHIYAAGDLSGRLPLASVASMQGRRIAEHLMGVQSRTHRHIDYDKAASAIFTVPEIADVGLAEADAFAEGRKVRVTKVPFSASPKALIESHTKGFVKIVSDPATGVVLGGSVVGRHAGELISVIAVAVTNGLCVGDIVDSLLVHPSLSEALAEAAE
ncbi:MAG: dihydrolipoyl dehydrogenase family protein [Acidimicrobiia bacterium]|jgi:NAD(P)H dehydrogenase (quinone)